MRRHRLFMFSILLIILSAYTSVPLDAFPAPSEDLRITKINDTTVDPEALTIKGGFGQRINGLAFQQEALWTLGNHQYLGYYDGKRRVCIARRALPEGTWEVIRFEDYHFKSNDAHNTISIGICARDGTIHMAFDHHGHPLHYRVSRKGVASDPVPDAWTAALFTGISSELEKGKPIKITYPRFWATPDGGLQFCYRRGGSGRGDRMLADYDDVSGTWKNTRQIDSQAGRFEDAKGKSESRCSYPNGYGYGPLGRLHTTWVWRESSQGANHDLMYAFSEDRGLTWKTGGGEPIQGPARVDTQGITVQEIPRTLGLMNTHGQAMDSKGRIHAVVWHCTEESLAAAGSHPGAHRWGPPEARRYHHYFRKRDHTWGHVELPWIAEDRPKLFIDEADTAYLIFRGDANLNIAAATAGAGWSDWRILHVEPGPFGNQMLGDPYRWKDDGVLSVMVQEAPETPHQPTALRVVDFMITNDESRKRNGVGTKEDPGAMKEPGPAKDSGATRGPGAVVWRVSDPVLRPGPKGGFDEISVKDPTIVNAEGKWHLFYTARSESEYTTGYVAAETPEGLQEAPRHPLKAIRGKSPYGCAPQVFRFSLQELWYLVFQTRDANYQPMYSTTRTLSDADSWSPPKPLLEKKEKAKWIDFWIICDETDAHLFYTRSHRDVVIRSTRLTDFPGGWGPAKTVLSGIHEAVHIYKVKDEPRYHMVYELNRKGMRSFGLADAPDLEGPWTKRTDAYATGDQLVHEGETWTEMVSHGEAIRCGNDERMEYDPKRCRWLIQGILKRDAFGPYELLPWKLGIVTREG